MILVNSFEKKYIDPSLVKTVAELKVLLAQQDGLPLDGIQLSCGSKNLDNKFSLGELSNPSIIDVIVPVLGGKVHGSLTRAGKVKGQTPKVEKKEKKKKQTGRAYRRMQYNKRFLTSVTLPGGRRRGPNSNVKA